MMRASVPSRWIALLLILMLLAGNLLSGPLSVRAAIPCGKWTIKADGQDTRVKIVPVTVGDDCRGSFRFENTTAALGLIGGYGLDLRVNGPANSGAEWVGTTGNIATLIPSLDSELLIAPKDVAKQIQIIIDGSATPQSFTIDMGLFLLMSALDLVPLPAVDCLIPKSAIAFAVGQSVQILDASADRLWHLDSAAFDELLQVTDEFFDKTIDSLKEVAKGCTAEILKPFLTKVLGAVTGFGSAFTVTKIVLGLAAYAAVMIADNVKYHGKSLHTTLTYEPATQPTPTPLPSLRSVNWADVLAHDPDLIVKNEAAICHYGELDISVVYKEAANVGGHPVTSKPANVAPDTHYDIQYGDLDGDGVEEAVVGLLTHCTGAFVTSALVYRMTSSGPRIAGYIPETTTSGFVVNIETTIVNGQLQVTNGVYQPGDSYARGPSGGIKITQYRLQGNMLVEVGSRVETPTPSPTAASEIAYVVQGDLWIANVDGTKARKVVSGPLQRPAWSHDGKRIAYLRQFSEQYPTQIEIVNADGSNKVIAVPQKANPRGTPQYQYLVRVRWEQSDAAIYFAYSYGNSSGKGIVRHDIQSGAERDMNIFAADFDVARDGTFVTESYDNTRGKVSSRSSRRVGNRRISCQLSRTAEYSPLVPSGRLMVHRLPCEEAVSVLSAVI